MKFQEGMQKRCTEGQGRQGWGWGVEARRSHNQTDQPRIADADEHGLEAQLEG